MLMMLLGVGLAGQTTHVLSVWGDPLARRVVRTTARVGDQGGRPLDVASAPCRHRHARALQGHLREVPEADASQVRTNEASSHFRSSSGAAYSIPHVRSVLKGYDFFEKRNGASHQPLHLCRHGMPDCRHCDDLQGRQDTRDGDNGRPDRRHVQIPGRVRRKRQGGHR